jgi:hypothetical protein
MQSEGHSQRTGLLNIYQDLLSRAENLPTDLVKRLGCPFLPFPQDRWFLCTFPLLVVGQDPFDWGFENVKGSLADSNPLVSWQHPRLRSLAEVLAYCRRCGVHLCVEAITSGYVISCDYPDSSGSHTPFNQAFDLLKRNINRGDPHGIISTNFFRCGFLRDRGSRSPLSNATREELRAIRQWQRNCLTREIETLRPSSVVFFTGPYYDDDLRDEFAGLRFEEVDGRDLRQFARLRHDSLPESSFRTYHPGYLKRSKRWPWLQKLASQLGDEYVHDETAAKD